MENYLFNEEEIGSVSVDTVEEKVDTLNYIQQAIKKLNEPLQDGVVYDGTLVGIDTLVIKEVPTLCYKYSVHGYEVSDMFFFSRNSADYSTERLTKTLEKFGFKLTIGTAVNGIESIMDYTKHLIGSEVRIIQKTRNDGKKDYFNYEIVEVIRSNN